MYAVHKTDKNDLSSSNVVEHNGYKVTDESTLIFTRND